jgi:aldehyde dehydrogenase (NAD+)
MGRRLLMLSHERLYIGGDWVLPNSPDSAIPVLNPATEEVLGEVPAADPVDAARAAATARSAFPGWAARAPAERAEHLARMHAALKARVDEVARMVAQEVGTPLERSAEWQAKQPVDVLGGYVELASRHVFEETVGNSLVISEPVGVAACITPWNFPLHQAMLKVAPALAAGCTVVLKPASLAPLNAYVLAEAVEEAGLPQGVFNLVPGPGPAVGEALAQHHDVDMVSFTGSSSAGRRLAAVASAGLKRSMLELGGKSANVILDDADLATAVPDGVHNCFANAGQTCAAWTRMLVPESLLADVEALAAETAAGYRLGDPLDPQTTLGPVISAEQRSNVLRHVAAGVTEGARLILGDLSAPASPDRGYFVGPTVLSGVRREMTVAQEEIFGPVLCILPYSSEAEAVEIANDSAYGLSGAVWSADADRAMRVARQIRTGQVFVNGASFNYQAPFGGFKDSGWGREFGEYGLSEYLDHKAVQL